MANATAIIHDGCCSNLHRKRKISQQDFCSLHFLTSARIVHVPYSVHCVHIRVVSTQIL